jgi:hypothetical protein
MDYNTLNIRPTALAAKSLRITKKMSLFSVAFHGLRKLILCAISTLFTTPHFNKI